MTYQNIHGEGFSAANEEIQWTYGIMRADGSMECMILKGPMKEGMLIDLVGGEVKFVPFNDGMVAAVRRDETGLPPNLHFGALRGNVVLGKMSNAVFVGALGVMVDSAGR